MQASRDLIGDWRLVNALGDAGPLLDQLTEQSPVGIAVIDLAGRLCSVNPAYCRLYGYPAQALLGQPFASLFPAAQREWVMSLHRRFLLDGTGLDGEWDLIRQDGQRVSVMAQSVRVRDAQGQPCRLVYVVDISQRRGAERALHASQQFLQSVLDGLTAQVCVLDDAGTIVAVNQAWRDFAAANGGPEDPLGEGSNYLAVCQRAAQAVGEAACTDAGHFAQQLRQVLGGARPGFELEYAAHSPHERRWFVARVARVAGSQPPCTVVAHDNVTALKQAQETLRDGEALLLDLAASIPGAMFRLLQRAGGGWRFVYFSPGIESLFELTPQAACGDIRILGAHILPEDKPTHDQSIRDAVARGRFWEHEYRIRTPSGRLKWVHAKASAKPGAGGDWIWTGVLTDVSERKHMDAVLKASEQKYRTLFETVPQGVVYHDASGRITSANPAAQRILGLTLEQMQGRHSVDARWQALHEDGSAFAADEYPAMRALHSGQPQHNVVMGVAVPGRGHVWLQVNAIPLLHLDVVREVYASFEDITERVMLNRELQLQASTDYLTGVANRRGLMERLQLEFDCMRQQPARRCAVVATDLDHFKDVNDRWGHAAGDAVLRHVARLMQQLTRHNDLVARSGGEEFALLLPTVGADEAVALAERLRQQLQASPLLHDGHRLTVTVSVGVSLMAAGDANADAALNRADQALYQAKADGRNAVRAMLQPG